MMRSTRKQNILVGITAFVFIVIVVLSTLVVTQMGKVRSTDGSQEAGYRNVTFTDAVILCEAETRERFGERLQTYFVDMHSSRFETRPNVFKVYLQADVMVRGGEERHTHYVDCFVEANRGRLVKLESYEDKGEEKVAPTQGDTNIFGYPLK